MKMKPTEPKRDDGIELETQVILRIPKEPAKALREAIQSGVGNLKDRLTIKLEPDLRYGEVRFDHWLMHAKVVDLPTVIESLKTIDNKSFYKTADICQMILCKDEPDAPSADEESPNKAKKKDPNKVDKKFLWPHGVTPPCKNIRKRRFRKTLKKKFVEAPEIEKEVKRLLRVDNEAVHVKYDIINEDEDHHHKGGSINQNPEPETEMERKSSSEYMEKKRIKDSRESESEVPEPIQTAPRGVVAEHDIFGGEVSSSDDEEVGPNVHDIEDTSRLSADDSRLSDFSIANSNVDKMLTEFNKSMFSPKSRKNDTNQEQLQHEASSSMAQDFYTPQNRSFDDNDSNEPQMSRDQINTRIMELQRELDDLKVQQAQKSQEISSIQNPTLRQRMQEIVDNLMSMILDKEMEMQDLQNMLG